MQRELKFNLGRSIGRRIVDSFAAVALLIAGAVVQSFGSRSDDDGTVLLIMGGVMVALGGVAISWIASSILAERQAAEAATQAREEVDQKLDNLSRVFGQAAGQISQAVEQAELQQIPPSTGFALVSQATRMIYGQVNEIGVIRGVKFDAAQLLETAAKLDELARQLSGSSAKNDDSEKVEELRRKIQIVQESLSVATPQRQIGEVRVDCAHCGAPNDVRLGSLPGDTATPRCVACGLMFNVHRAQTGATFTRPRLIGGTTATSPLGPPKPPRWNFLCPACAKRLSSAIDEKGTRLMVCTSCLATLEVDPIGQVVTAAATAFTKTELETFSRKGKRPRFLCPSCSKSIVAMLTGDRGFIGMCETDKFVFEIAFADFQKLYDSETAPT